MRHRICLGKLEKLQQKLSKKISLNNGFDKIELVAGVDQSFPSNKIISAVVVANQNLDIIEKTHAIMNQKFPYMPGFLWFREGPAIIKSFKKLKTKPDLLFVNGCGIDHPRFIGLASHVGLILDVPTIGITQKLLCGECIPVEEHHGCSSIVYKNKTVGYVLKTKLSNLRFDKSSALLTKNSKIYISPGHKISLKSSLEITKKFLKNHKLPEPLYLAHEYANEVKTKISHHN